MVQFSDQVVMLNVIWLFEDCVEVSSGLIHYQIDSMQCEMSSQETVFFLYMTKVTQTEML